MATVFTLPFTPALGLNGLVEGGSMLFFAQPGTLTAKSVYTTPALTTAHANPVVADASGRFPDIYLDPKELYRVRLETSLGVELGDVDEYAGPDAGLRADLAASTGASLVSWIGSAVGAVARTITNLFAERVSVLDFIPVAYHAAILDGTSTQDVTSYIQAAINSLSAGGKLRLPRGRLVITAALTNSTTGVTIEGDNRWTTTILQNTLTAGIISSTGTFLQLRNVRLAYGGTPDPNATAIYSAGSYSHFDNFAVSNAGIGVHLKTGVAQKLTNFDILDYETNGIRIEALNDAYISKFILNAGNTTRGSLGGIRLIDKAEAIVVSDGDIIYGAYSMTMAATTDGVGTRPAYSRFTNVYFDSSANGVSIDKCVEMDFTGCWFSNRPGNGVTLNTCDGVRFTGGGAINCAQSGVVVTAAAKRVVFNGFAARGNSTELAGSYHGINIAAATTDFSVTGCILGGTLGFGSQGYGVIVSAGASDRYIITNNLVSGNATGGVSDGGTGTNKLVSGNF